ncbi:FAD-dependent oxidoreductase [Nocardioides sp. NPDC127514]|uniref:NAD(P)/FAD-dependent oxidoreductase n=1 Tax=unclassified Nocardioides TaxID=2615069 RepID=UPI0033246EAD
MNGHGLVIVGGGLAGLSTAKTLRAGGYTAPVIILDPADFPYDRPPLSKEYLAGTRTAEDIALLGAHWFTENDVDFRGGQRVRSLVPSEDHVSLILETGDQLIAEQVVLALGADAIIPPVPGIERHTVHTLRDLPDADRLRKAFAPGSSLLIVGAGLIGAEVASTATKQGVRVTLVDTAEVPLAGAVGTDTAAWLHQMHREHGVETVQTTLRRLEEAHPGVIAHLSGELAPRRFDAVLVSCGSQPRTALAEEAELTVDGGIIVDTDQRTSHPRVLAVGDCSRVRDRPRAEHWEAAKLTGERAAATLLGEPGKPEAPPWFWTDRYDYHVEAVGDLATDEAGAPATFIRRGGAESWSYLAISAGRLRGAICVNDAASMGVFRRLVDQRVTVDAFTLQDPSTNLRKLLRK